MHYISESLTSVQFINDILSQQLGTQTGTIARTPNASLDPAGYFHLSDSTGYYIHLNEADDALNAIRSVRQLQALMAGQSATHEDPPAIRVEGQFRLRPQDISSGFSQHEFYETGFNPASYRTNQKLSYPSDHCIVLAGHATAEEAERWRQTVQSASDTLTGITSFVNKLNTNVAVSHVTATYAPSGGCEFEIRLKAPYASLSRRAIPTAREDRYSEGVIRVDIRDMASPDVRAGIEAALRPNIDQILDLARRPCSTKDHGNRLKS